MASKLHEYAEMEFSKMSGKDPYQVRDSEGIMCAITLSHNSSQPASTVVAPKCLPPRRG